MIKKADKADTIPEKNEAQEPVKTPEQIEAEKQKAEQERTKKAKAEFLTAFENSMGIITTSCQKAKVGRSTYYEWMQEDPAFKAEVERVNKMLIDYSEDKLKQAIIKGSLKAILFHLRAKHPEYRAKLENIVKDERTLEDLFDEQAEKEAEEARSLLEKNKNETDGQSIGNGRVAENQKQEGQNSSVPAQPGSDPLPPKEEGKKPDTEIPAKGNNG